MLCSDSLSADRVASHREDNGFRNIPDIVFDIDPSPGQEHRRRARTPGEQWTTPHPPQSSEQELFPVLIPPSQRTCWVVMVEALVIWRQS